MTVYGRAEQATQVAVDAAISAAASPAVATAARPATRRLVPVVLTAAVLMVAVAGGGLLIFGGATIAPTLMTAAANTPTSPVACTTVDVEVGELPPGVLEKLSGDERQRQQQINHAATIIAVGKAQEVPARGWVVALATAMQESRLLNLASQKMPGSEQYPNDGVAAGDHDSVGTFQQRPPWWSNDLAKGMNAEYQARQFYGGADDTPTIPGLLDITGWEQLPVTVAAQRVQRSAFPDAYAQWEAMATGLVQALEGVDPGTCAAAGSVTAGQWTWPLAPSTISSPYGMRLHPTLGYWKLHDGTDFGAVCGTPFVAAAAGTVTSTAMLAGYGGTTVIDHGGNVETWYAHQATFAVQQGQQVQAGDVVGYVGSTGYSTGCHLHWMVKVDGQPFDPEQWMEQQGDAA